MIEYLESLDQTLFLELNGHHNATMDIVMWLISTIFPWIVVFLFIFYYAYRKGKLKFLLLILLGIGLCVLLADRISVLAFKQVFLRYRPTHNLEIGDLVHTIISPFSSEEYRGGKYGFVSSHAANFFAIATYVYLCFKSYSKLWLLLFLWASLIGYSRIYLGVHYPSDIFGGAILGLGIGFLVYKLLNKISYEHT